MTADEVLLWIHIVAASVWVGGLITLGALVTALRRAGAERPLLQAMARRFGVVSWVAMAVAVATGVWQVSRLNIPWSNNRLELKIGLVVLAAGLALLHQLTAKRTSPAVRGIIQAVILVVSIAIVGAAVRV
jgi:putative copper export protein